MYDRICINVHSLHHPIFSTLKTHKICYGNLQGSYVEHSSIIYDSLNLDLYAIAMLPEFMNPWMRKIGWYICVHVYCILSYVKCVVIMLCLHDHDAMYDDILSLPHHSKDDCIELSISHTYVAICQFYTIKL